MRWALPPRLRAGGRQGGAIIGGQWREYLEMELAAFRDGSRSMSKRKARAFEHLDDAELAAVAAFFASRTDLQR